MRCSLPGSCNGIDNSRLSQALFRQQSFKCGQPMRVIIMAVLGGVTAMQLGTERGSPFSGRKDALILQGNDQSESLSFPGFAEDWT